MFTRERLTRWTRSLRENGHLQAPDRLMHIDGRQCCLGHLAVLENIPHASYRLSASEEFCEIRFNFPGFAEVETSVLRGDLAKELGEEGGGFAFLKMPRIEYGGLTFHSLASANDGEVPWKILAYHLDRHYPCSDEPRWGKPPYSVCYEQV